MEKQNTCISVYASIGMAQQLKVESEKSGLPSSTIVVLALIDYFKSKKLETDERLKHVIQDSEENVWRQISKDRSIKLMKEEGWKGAITLIIIKWIKKHRELPSKLLEQSWIHDGIEHKKSFDVAKKIVENAILAGKLETFGDQPLKITQDGKTITIRRDIKRARSKKVIA